MYENTHRRQRGMSLIEVFVALLVLSVGLIALARLQVDLVRGGSDARTRSVALALAEEKVEDLRTFAATDNSPSNPTLCPSWSTTASPMCWARITGPALATPANTTCSPAACEGGRIAPQTTYSSALEVAGVRFKRTWEVDSRDFTNAGPPSITSRTKDVRVTVAWLNELGVEQQVSVLANVVEIPPGNVALASQPIEERPSGPRIVYQEGVAPEVIAVPIDTGSGKRETTKPLPDVQAQGDYAHEVTFDVVNYHLDGGENVVDRREEFVTVNCRCTLQASGSGRTPARVAFTGNVLRDQPGAVVPNKPFTGTVRTSGSDSKSSQPVLCSLCCRDHHDGPAVTVGSDTDYNRYNPTDTSNHGHYLRNDSTNPPTYTLASVGGAYDEACRLKRVNGVFQVYEDWKLATILAMPESDLTNVSIQTAFTDFVQNFVKNSANSTLPAGAVPTFSTTTLVPGGAQQLSGRAIYIDRMPQNLVDFLNTSPPPANFLSYVPFFEINLTKLANWKLQTINTDSDYLTVDGQTCGGTVSQATLAGKIACVANQAIVDETVINIGGFQNYFRGLIKAGPVAGQLDAQVFARNGNTSITGTFPLTAAAASSTPVSSEYRFTVDAGQAISGQVTKGANAPNGNFWGNITITAATNCGPLTGTGNASRSFTCSVPTGWTGSVVASWSGHSFIATNNVFPPNVLPASNVSFVLDP